MRLLCSSLLLFLVFAFLPAQQAAKFGYVDTEYILSKIPEFKQAQQELDKISVEWQKEIEAKYAEVDKLYKAYQADAVLLTEEMKRKRENEIINKEKEVKELQKKRLVWTGNFSKSGRNLLSRCKIRFTMPSKPWLKKKDWDLSWIKLVRLP